MKFIKLSKIFSVLYVISVCNLAISETFFCNGTGKFESKGIFIELTWPNSSAHKFRVPGYEIDFSISKRNPEDPLMFLIISELNEEQQLTPTLTETDKKVVSVVGGMSQRVMYIEDESSRSESTRSVFGCKASSLR